MNTSEPLCKAKTNMTLMEEARKAQQKFLKSIIKIELEDVIHNINSRVYPGGPTLRESDMWYERSGNRNAALSWGRPNRTGDVYPDLLQENRRGGQKMQLKDWES